jgi:hypothetical protein
MRTIVLAIALLLGLEAPAATYTEFYVQTTGNNLNAGSTTANASAYTSVNGNWNGTTLFIPTDGSNPSASVNVGDWASVYLDAATVAVYIAKVTTVTNAVNGGIILSTTATSGTAPTSSATGRSIKVGGAWKGPNAAVGFPFGAVLTGTLTNSPGQTTRVNVKGGVTYSITAGVTQSGAGPLIVHGYTTTVDDGGMATIDGGAGASYAMFTMNGANTDWSNFIFANNGAAGAFDAVNVSASRQTVRNCVFHDMGGNGVAVSGASMLVSCEIYKCNTGNTSGKGGVNMSGSGSAASMCFSHHNTTANASGFTLTNPEVLNNCISAFNGNSGFKCSSAIELYLNNCVAYSNVNAAVESAANATMFHLVSCAFFKNGYGIKVSSASSGIGSGLVLNCAFGSGTMTNANGNYNSVLYGGASDPSVVAGLTAVNQITFTADVTPWVAPDTGDYRNASALVRGVGYQTFTQTYPTTTWTGTVGYPDVGAVQQNAANGSGSYGTSQ